MITLTIGTETQKDILNKLAEMEDYGSLGLSNILHKRLGGYQSFAPAGKSYSCDYISFDYRLVIPNAFEKDVKFDTCYFRVVNDLKLSADFKEHVVFRIDKYITKTTPSGRYKTVDCGVLMGDDNGYGDGYPMYFIVDKDLNFNLSSAVESFRKHLENTKSVETDSEILDMIR